MRVTRTRTRAVRVSVVMVMVVVVMSVSMVVLRVMLSAVVRVVVVPRPRGERATSVSVAGTKPTEHRGKTWERASMETAMVVMYLMLTARGGQRGAEITCWAGHPLLERRCSEWMRCLLTWMVWCTRVRGPFQMLLRAYEKWRCECRWDISPTTPPAVTARSRHTCGSWGWMSRPNTLSPHRRPPCGCWPNTLPHPRACLWSVGRNMGWASAVAGGIAPGNGTLVSAVHTAAERMPLVAGKPETPIFVEACSRFVVRTPLMSGDRLDTDILGAHRAGLVSALVLTGIDGAKQVLSADAASRPRSILGTLAELHEAYPLTTVAADATVTVGRARVRVEGRRVVIINSGQNKLDLLRAGCRAIWNSSVGIHSMDVPEELYR